MKRKVLGFLATAILAMGLNAATFNVDAAHSSVEFKVRHMMISNVKGHFDEFSGVIGYDEDKKQLTSLKGVIKTASINTGIQKRDEHLRSADFFDAPKYPEITFTMDKIEGDKVYGKLNMRGVEKEIVLDYDFGGVIKDPWGNQRVGMTLEGEINRLDYGVKYNSVLDTGGVSVGNEVKMIIELEAIKQK